MINDSAYQASQAHAARAVQANRGPRYLRLDRLEQFVETTQYDGMPNWFDDGPDAKPLRERRPCVQYPIVAAAIDSNTDLCLGEGRFPGIIVSDADGVEDGTQDARKLANKALARLIKVARLKPAFREAFAQAQGCGSVAVICGVSIHDQKPFAHVEKAKWSSPTFAPDGKTVLKLEIRYPYTKEERDPEGAWKVKAYLYRRVIDGTSDITFKPLEARTDGENPPDSAWKVDKDLSYEHNLGFCPVVWYPFMIGCATIARFDGRAIHSRSLDEIHDLDISLSQRHRAAFFAGDPQIILKNAQELRAGVGRTVRDAAESQASDPHFKPLRKDGQVGDGPGPGGLSVAGFENRTKPALKKSPGELWQLDGENADAELLALPGDALDAIDKDARDLRNKVCEALAVVFTDPENVQYATALSGKAQQMLRARQIDRCNQYREDMGDNLIIPVVQMLVRIIQHLLGIAERSGGAYASPVRSKAIVSGIGELAKFDDVDLDLKWGDYWDPDPDEELKVAKLINEADKALPIPDEDKANKLARAFNVDNSADFAERVKAEREKRFKEQQERFKSEADAFHGKAVSENGAVGTGNRGAAGAGSEKNVGSGSSPVAAPPPRGRAVPGSRRSAASSD